MYVFIAELLALPPRELVSDVDLTEKYGLLPALWLNVALIVMEQGASLVIEGKPGVQGRFYRLMQQTEEMEAEADSEFLDECLRLLDIDAEQSHTAAEMGGYTPSTN